MRLGLIFGAMLISAGAVAQPIFFDDFSVDQKALVRSDSGLSTNTVNLGSGVTRTQILDVLLNGDSDGISRATTRISGGWLSFSSDDFVTAASGLTYNFNGPINLINNNVFNFNFGRMDQNSTLNVILKSGASSVSSQSIISASNTAFSHLSNSSYTGSAGFNYGSVDQIMFNIAGPESVDFRVDSIEAVPEPATLAAVAVGIAGILRRRKANK